MRKRPGQAFALSLAVALAGCGDDSGLSPTVDDVAGAYSATIFTLDLGAGTVNRLVLGAEVAMTLAPDGTTTGHLFVPGAGVDGGDVDADLAGTWTLNAGGVTFHQAADTFIREMTFAVEGDHLTGETWSGHNSVYLVLTKSQ